MKVLLANLFRLNLREPFSFLYNLIVPLGVLLALLLLDKNRPQSFTEAIQLITAFGGYTIYSSSFFGVGQSLAGWREEGIFLTFCKDRIALQRLIISQGALRSLVTTGYFTILLTATAVTFRSIPGPHILALIPVAFFCSLLTSALSLVVLLIPWSPRDVGSVLGLSVFVFLFLYGLGRAGSPKEFDFIHLANTFNPISWNALVLEITTGAKRSIVDWLSAGTGLLVFVLFTVTAFMKFHRYPILARL